MVSTLYVVRDSAGVMTRGSLSGEVGNQYIQAGRGQEISLNLARESITGYKRHGNDLAISLVDGNEIFIGDYFAHPQAPSQLYLSQNGELVVVQLQPSASGGYAVAYGGAHGWEKYSSIDALRFAGADPLLGYGGEEVATGFVPFAGLGWAFLGLGGAAAVAGGSGGGGDGDPPDPPNPPGGGQPSGPAIRLTQGVVSVNHVENAAAYANGVQIGGTGTVGGLVTVTLASGAVQTTTVREDGSWIVTFRQDQVRSDQYIIGLSAKIVDANGLSTTITDDLQVDTIVQPLTAQLREPNVSGGRYLDQVINQSEANYFEASQGQNGVWIEGVVEAGAKSVSVWFGNSGAIAATITGTSWQAFVPAHFIPLGNANGKATVDVIYRAIDRYDNDSGNLLLKVEVDRAVVPLTLTPLAAVADGYLNGRELGSGLTFSGHVEANITGDSSRNSRVTLRLIDSHGQTIGSHDIIANADGTWNVTVDKALFNALPAGELVSVHLSGTDPYGNIVDKSNVTSFRVDTKVDTLVVLKVAAETGTNLITDLYLNLDAENLALFRLDGTGSAQSLDYTVAHATTYLPNQGSTAVEHVSFRAADAVNGSYLVIKNTDLAGNEASTLFVNNATSGQSIDLTRLNKSGQSSFDFAAIDLTWAEAATLTLNTTDLRRLTGGDNDLIIRGESNDVVNLVGVASYGSSQSIHGAIYNVYIMTDGQRVLIENDITLGTRVI